MQEYTMNHNKTILDDIFSRKELAALVLELGKILAVCISERISAFIKRGNST